MVRAKKSPILVKAAPTPRRGSLPTISFRGRDEGRILQREVRGVLLTGSLREAAAHHVCNIIESAIDSLVAEDVDLTGCDLKDNAIRSSHFLNTKFDSSSITYSSFSSTSFEFCTFEKSDIQNCDFQAVDFRQCDFSNLLIKACVFEKCEFFGCRTNNKLFETSRFIDCIFRETELQAESVAENFGLTRPQYHGALRSGRADQIHQRLRPEALAGWMAKRELHPLQQLNIEFFLTCDLMAGSRRLDAALDVSSWIRATQSGGSFALTLTRWADFLLSLFDRNELTVHTLLRLHNTTDQLLRSIEHAAPQASWAAPIRGVHLSLARIVDEYLSTLEVFTADTAFELMFLVDGFRSRKAYERHLQSLFKRAPGSRITKLVIHNSPWDMEVWFPHGAGALLFMALFLATRTRMELSRLARSSAETSPRVALPEKLPKAKGAKRKVKSAESESLLTIEFGAARSINKAPHLRLRAYLPGDLIAELQLDVASAQIAKLRKIVKDLL